ncbi:MAG: helix-turn-helix domain-containing protein [Thermomicrobiales bacterium]
MSEKRIIVTEENFGDLLIQSAQEALAYVRGDQSRGRVRVRTSPVTLTMPPPPGPYTPEQIHAIRMRLGLKQRQFADVLNVSDKTVKAWEQGINPPSGPALRLLQIAELHPEVFWGRREA